MDKLQRFCDLIYVICICCVQLSEEVPSEEHGVHVERWDEVSDSSVGVECSGGSGAGECATRAGEEESCGAGNHQGDENT